ncbi:MAG: sensor histidine kinase [Acidimicrobiia bacterium]
MKRFAGATAVLLMLVVGAVAIALPGQGPWTVRVLVVCATALPAIGAYYGAKKARRLGGREGLAWRVMASAMVLMTPIYLAEFVGAFAVETVLIALAYTMGAIAVLIVPLPNAGPYQRLVAGLDALALGVVVGTVTFWMVLGSEIDVAGHAVWAMSDAAIMAMIGYVAMRRGQERGIDWPLFWLMAGVGGYLGGILISSISEAPYYIGHPSDFAYFFGMAAFALGAVVREQEQQASRQILKPVRWIHVLPPYILVVVLAAALIPHEIAELATDPTGSIIELGILLTILVVLLRQLAMIAEQRRKIEIEQSGVIATVSHELRTPLTTVMGFLDLLEDWGGFSEEEKVEMVTMMRNQSHVMARVVGDLISVARQEIEQLEITRAAVDVDELVQSAVELVPEIEESALRIQIADGTTMTADRERLIQIITNYLSNAAKYGSGRVDLTVFEEAGETVIEVHDDGPGVPDIFHLVIWERFERGPQRQGAIPGSGIGLSVARGIARSHGGETHYRRSERLGGSCFTVRIPLHLPLLQQPAPFEPALPA